MSSRHAVHVAAEALIVTIIGWGTGMGVAGFFVNEAAAQTCEFEHVDWGDGGQNVQDSDDGVIEDNEWFFHAGQDFGRSLGCSDGDIDGQADNDDVGGGSGVDTVLGGANNDSVFGGADADTLKGNDGADTMEDVETNDSDTLDGGAGGDTTDVRDGDGLDLTDGGAGSDTCRSNANDREVNCNP